MIIQGNNDDILLAIPKEVEDAKSIYACIVDSTGVLKEWTTEHVIINKKILCLPMKREDSLNLPRGAVYIEVYARDAAGNMFWSRRIPEYVDYRGGNKGIGVLINSETLHGNIISYDLAYDAGEKALHMWGGE